MPATTTKPPTIDVRLIIPFVNSARNVMSTMLSIEATVGRPQLKARPGPEYDYSGIISFSGNLAGTVVVSFHQDAAAKLVEAFAGSPLPADSSDFVDAIGELTNMIAGGAKKDLGSTANISVPTVVMGRGHVVARPHDVPCLVIPCQTPLGGFALEIAIKTV